jgi:hypothetical protein
LHIRHPLLRYYYRVTSHWASAAGECWKEAIILKAKATISWRHRYAFSRLQHLIKLFFSSSFHSQVHWWNHNFPCSQFMHKNLAWKCVLVNEHGALIESKVTHWKTISRDRLRQCLVKTVTKCASEKLISFAGEFYLLFIIFFLFLKPFLKFFSHFFNVLCFFLFCKINYCCCFFFD